MNNLLKKYFVKYIDDKQLKISGKGKDSLWDKANILLDFCSPWDSDEIKKIEFKALWSKDTFFFRFKVNDSEIHIDTTDNYIDSINNSDRVELFFRTNDSLDPYYCLEIDPTPRIMDFKAHPNKQFDFAWNWSSKDIKVKSSIVKNAFTVEGAISITSLTKLGLIKDGKIEAGIYRAKYNKQKDGSYMPTWITWVNPNTELPNFHTSSSFGVLLLENQ
ncbi:MAG: hypothetical protein RL308_1521 [Bacteroidota bacterium]|jgi:hypothetical protein